METVGDRVRASREAAKLSQEDLAAAVGITPDKLSKIEHDTRRLAGAELVVIARELGVKIDSLLYGQPEIALRGDGDTPEAKEGMAKFDRFIGNYRMLRRLAAIR